MFDLSNGALHGLGGQGNALSSPMPDRPDLPGFDWNRALGGNGRPRMGYVRNWYQDNQGTVPNDLMMQGLNYLRALRGQRGNAHGNTGIVPPGAAPQTNPAFAPVPLPQQGPGAVGSQLGVIGMQPANNPYGLPTY